MPSPPDPLRIFAPRLITWHARHGRHDLPWQNTRDPYRIWVSEIMLQQTQVTTVIPYFLRFMQSFPTIAELADAPSETVMAHWSGLGYYARARNLHRAAQVMRDQHGGKFPEAIEDIEALPGIGRSTAAAIAAFAFGQRRAILDGNVKRVLARCFGIEGFPGERKIELAMWDLAESLLPAAKDVPVYIQAQMDLGATVCVRSRPLCAVCPMNDICVAAKEGRTASLPTRRPAKVVPRRETAMLILLSGREVLLERRPPQGIWGALWSFPEIEPAENASAIANIRYRIEGGSGPTLSAIEHGFTHFHLTIHPRIVEVTRRDSSAREPGLMWMNVEDALLAAIPKPVKTLLETVQKLR